MRVFDGHSDLLYDVTRRRLAGETRVLERHHLDRLRQGGIEGLMLALWTSVGDGESFWKEIPGGETDQGRTEFMCRCAREELAECTALQVVHDRAQAEKAAAEGKLYTFLGVEGMAAARGDPAAVDRYADWGARLGMLTWNEENAFATGAGGDPDQGLTAAGREAVQRMETRGMLVDVSHLNDRGFWDVMDMTHGPVIASHSNCRSLCPVRRNLTDEQLRAIRDSGGVVGVNVYRGFVHQDPDCQTVEMLARHAAHLAEVMGTAHVACGFDFCEFFGDGNEGVRGMEDASCTGNFCAALEKLGMSRREMEQITRENFLRVLG